MASSCHTDSPIRVLLSAGGGRLHFIETANALNDAGVEVSLVLGLIPSARWNRLYDWCGRLLGRKKLSERLQARTRGTKLPRERLHSCGRAEIAIYAALAASRFHLLPETPFQAITWRYFGRQSRKFLRGQQIFHVRSGAGRGGAIQAARKLGMKVVVDHSIAHPKTISEVLGPVFRRQGKRLTITPTDPFWRQVMRDCEEADLVLVNSDYVRDSFLEAGFPAERIRVGYLGVRPDFTGLKQDYALGKPPRLLFTGSFELRKGADTLIEAMNELHRDGPPCELHVFGSLSEAGPIVAGARNRDAVRLHGSVPQEQLAGWLGTSDLYVFPTLAEGCAKSAMEAMAAGLPVITTRACGLPDAARDFFREVPPSDPSALANAIRGLLADHDARERFGRGGASLVARSFSWNDYGVGVRAIYEELLSR